MGRRRGRRDNGLDAADYAAVGDLDPRVGEHLLDLLGARGIAAYLQPSMDVNPITRNSTVPDRPVDRLYADRVHLSTARDFLRRLTAEDTPAEQATPEVFGPEPSDQRPDPPAPDNEAGNVRASGSGTSRPDPSPATPGQYDATFAGIVAGFDRPVDPTSVTWPAAENLTEPEPPASAAVTRGPVDARHLTEPSLLGGPDPSEPDVPRDLPGDEQGEGQFVPPPPPPLPRLSRQAVLGGVAVLVGLTLLLAPGAGPFDRSESILLGFAAIFGGAVALILRLRPGTDPDDHHPDDGARV